MPAGTLEKEMFAEAYGWSEQQTENASLDALAWYPLIREARHHAIEVEQKQQASQNRARH
jgi:hypothetical protein